MFRLQAELRAVFIVDGNVERGRFVDFKCDALGVDEIALNRISPLMEPDGDSMSKLAMKDRKRKSGSRQT